MCLGIPGQIEELLEHEDLAKVNVGGVRRNINIGLVASDGIGPGDWVLIHVGFAMSKIDEEEAKATLSFLSELGREFEDEIEAFKESEIT